MDGAEPERWSAVADDWAQLWGDVAIPVWRRVVATTGIGRGSHVLDVGCGSGDFLAHLDMLGAATAGIDPAAGMAELARSRIAAAEIRIGSGERLPWPDDAFDLATAFNALQLVNNPLAAIAEMVRVTKPGGLVAIANWAEDERNDLAAVEAALARAAGDQPRSGGPLRQQGGLERLQRVPSCRRPHPGPRTTDQPRHPIIGKLKELNVPTPKIPQRLDHTFTASIQKDGTYPTYLTVPDSADILGTRRPVKVSGTIDGQAFTATLMPSGEGPHWLPIKAELRNLIGKHQAGAEVRVHLQQRLS